MGAIKTKYFYRRTPDAVLVRQVPYHEPDPRDLDVNGNPPAIFLKPDLTPAAGEREFDHELTAEEIAREFPVEAAHE